MQKLLHMVFGFFVAGFLHKYHAQHVLQLGSLMRWINLQSTTRASLSGLEILQGVVTHRVLKPGIGKIDGIQRQDLICVLHHILPLTVAHG